MSSEYRKAYLRKWEEENREHRSAYKIKHYQDHKDERKKKAREAYHKQKKK